MRSEAGAGFGTPPRRRGGPDVGVVVVVAPRNTPASAGKTRQEYGNLASLAEHPRVGGEDADTWTDVVGGGGTPPRRRGGRSSRTAVSPLIGTPPRRRGGLLVVGAARRPRRNTPASAGRTAAAWRASSGASEHPRVGGEDDGGGVLGDVLGGTPPRRRGGLESGGAEPVRCRNTPASAGRTSPSRPPKSAGTEHPRVGGEDT